LADDAVLDNLCSVHLAIRDQRDIESSRLPFPLLRRVFIQSRRFLLIFQRKTDFIKSSLFLAIKRKCGGSSDLVFDVPLIIKSGSYVAILLFNFDIIMLLNKHYKIMPQSMFNKRNSHCTRFQCFAQICFRHTLKNFTDDKLSREIAQKKAGLK